LEIAVTECAQGYHASLFGGWWVAYGSTAMDAVKNVVDNYEKELAGMTAKDKNVTNDRT
jgi:hypothetical protein